MGIVAAKVDNLDIVRGPGSQSNQYIPDTEGAVEFFLSYHSDYTAGFIMI